MRLGAKSAHALSTFRHLCAFSCIPTLFSSNGWWWVSFLDNFLWGIHSHHQKCDWVQKVRPHSALLGTCAHFHAYLHYFPQMDGDGCHFWKKMLWWIHSNHQKCDWVQKVRTHLALLGTCAHFNAYLHFFPQINGDGCHFWIFFMGNSFPSSKMR